MIAQSALTYCYSKIPAFISTGLCSIMDENSIAITIDDGPHIRATDQSLEALRKTELKATYFLVGSNVKRCPELARRCAEEGHVIASHGYNHRIHLTFRTKETHRSLQEASDTIQNAAGVCPELFRPPYGLWNPYNNSILKKLGLTIVFWTLMAGDFHKSISLDFIQTMFRERLKGGDIIVLHDNDQTERRIGEIIHILAEEMARKSLHSSFIRCERNAQRLK